MHNSCKTYKVQIIPLHLKKKNSSHNICDKKFPIYNFLQYILNPFCNTDKSKQFINLLKKCLSFWFNYPSSLFQNLLSFQPHKMLWFLNFHWISSIKQSGLTTLLQLLIGEKKVTLFTSNLAISICCSCWRKSLTPSSPRFGQQMYWMTSSSHSQVLVLLYNTASHKVKYQRVVNNSCQQ